MKKKMLFPIALVSALVISGCVKENFNDASDVEVGTVEFTAGIDTKTVLQGDKTVLWTNGDKINVNGNESAALELENPSVTATFKFTDAVIEGPSYNAVFPASLYKDENTVTLPAYQKYKAGTFAEAASPMAAHSATKDLVFHHLCAVIKLNVTLPADSEHSEIAYVDFYGKNGEQVSGDFTIDYEKASLAGASKAEADKKIRYTVDKAFEDGKFEMYIVVPAGDYTNGYVVKLLDSRGHYMEVEKKSTATLVAGKIYDMPSFEFVPDKTEFGVEIASADDLIKFAQAYNAGKYADEDLLIATLTSDITFDETTSAAFAETGGIGTDKGVDGNTNYFNGVFNGNNFSISGLNTTVPVFQFTGSASKIVNLTLADDCILTTESADFGTNHAPLVGRNKGLVQNCTSHASVVINNLQDVDGGTQYYGGLVGRNYGGVLDGCVATGDITCSQSEVTITKNSVGIGGIAGSHADNGSITGCDYLGNIIISDDSEYGGITTTKIYFYVGGIAGYVSDGGKMSGCTSGTESTSTVIDVRGNLVPAIGGVLGWVVDADIEISGCVNRMSISFTSDGERGNTTPARVGGIAGRSKADISYCDNFGQITTLSNSTSIYLAGIVGDGAGVSDCTNNAVGKITRSSQKTDDESNRYIYIGGVIATNNSACDVERCVNNAPLLSNASATAKATTVDVGGVVGWAQNQMDIRNCENIGDVTADDQSNTTVITRITVGGILAYGPIANTTIVECDNSGSIKSNYTKKANDRCSYTGGIAGLMGTTTAGVGGLKIERCNNTGELRSGSYNNTVNALAKTNFGGGIVGAINGLGDDKALVQNCTSSDKQVYNYRGICGGIAGYAGNVSLADNKASQLLGANASGKGNGGVVGWMVSSDMAGCTFSGTISGAMNVAGLAYLMDGHSSIEKCKVDGAVLTKGGSAESDAVVLVSIAEADVAITDCGIKGTLKNGSDENISLESTMIATDNGAIVSGTYLLN